MTPEEFLGLFDEDHRAPDCAELIEQGEWENDYKDWCSRESIYQVGDQYFSVIDNRTGNYYSGDYEWQDPNVFEVVPEVVSITRYVAKPDDSKD